MVAFSNCYTLVHAGSAGAIESIDVAVVHLHRITESLLFVAFVKCVMSMINNITIHLK